MRRTPILHPLAEEEFLRFEQVFALRRAICFHPIRPIAAILRLGNESLPAVARRNITAGQHVGDRSDGLDVGDRMPRMLEMGDGRNRPTRASSSLGNPVTTKPAY